MNDNNAAESVSKLPGVGSEGFVIPEGLALEPTYTAKALAAMLERCAAVADGRPRLFWNTVNSRDTGPLLDGARRPLPPEVQRWMDRG